MTAYAVGGESRDIIVEFGTSRYPAERLVADPRSGVAILRIECDDSLAADRQFGRIEDGLAGYYNRISDGSFRHSNLRNDWRF